MKALDLLAAAPRHEPTNPRYAYVYAVALNDAGKTTDAIEVLEASINAHPYDRDSLRALATFLEQAGDSARARGYAQRLSELEPGNPDVSQMLKQLSRNRNGQ